MSIYSSIIAIWIILISFRLRYQWIPCIGFYIFTYLYRWHCWSFSLFYTMPSNNLKILPKRKIKKNVKIVYLFNSAWASTILETSWKASFSWVTYTHKLSNTFIFLYRLKFLNYELANCSTSHALQHMALLSKGCPDIPRNLKVVADHCCPVLVVHYVRYQLGKTEEEHKRN